VTPSEGKAASEEPGGEQRRYPRLSCSGIVDLRVIPGGGKETGALINLSKRGCFFLADKPLRGSEGASIEIHLKVHGIDFRVAGVIRHVRKGIRAGIEFVRLSQRKCEQINELIGELAELDQQAHKARQAELKRRDEEILDREGRQEARKRADRVRSRLLKFYRR
jgi:hypothetical protein